MCASQKMTVFELFGTLFIFNIIVYKVCGLNNKSKINCVQS